MAQARKTREVNSRWNNQDEERPSFVPIIPTDEMDLSHVIHPKAALKMVQVIENAHMGMMWSGYRRILGDGDITFDSIGPGEFILMINSQRNYIKLIVGNGTDNPVIMAYRLPPRMLIPQQAIDEMARSLLKKGHIQADERLREAIGESLRDRASN